MHIFYGCEASSINEYKNLVDAQVTYQSKENLENWTV